MKTKHERDWTAVIRGDLYCAPACGGGCTKAAFDLATERGKALARRLGKNWPYRVHENLGWHYCAELNPGVTTAHGEMVLKVYEDRERGPFISADYVTYHTLFGA